jgi:two-component system OmpR family response regulator
MKETQQKPSRGKGYGTLLSLFGRKIKQESTPSPEPAAETEPVVPAIAFAQGRKVLIADDDPVFCKATENRLRAYGFDVATALSGSEAIQAARSEAPDVILLDLDFPAELPTSWDGFTIMEWLNQMNWFPNTPVIICTGKSEPDIEDRAKSTRAAAVLRKPLDYTALLGLIEFKLNQRGSLGFQPGEN